MSTITKEQAQKIIEASDDVITALAGKNEDVHPESDSILRLWDDLNDRYAPPEVVRELARIALASLEAEAVAYTDAEELRFHHATSDMWPVPLGHGMDLPLYAAPPAPISVPVALNRLRSIVADPRALPRRKEWISGQQYSYVLLENVEAMVDDACRAAMPQELQKSAGVSNNCRSNENVQGLQAGNSPGIPDGWKLVPVEPTANQWAAGMQAFDSGVDKVTRVYKAMLAAAPQQEVK